MTTIDKSLDDRASRTPEESLGKVMAEVADFPSNSADWIICHLDIDVVDPAIISAVNYPSKGGLTLEEVGRIIETLRKTTLPWTRTGGWVGLF